MGFEHEYLAQFPTVLNITALGHLQEIWTLNSSYFIGFFETRHIVKWSEVLQFLSVSLPRDIVFETSYLERTDIPANNTVNMFNPRFPADVSAEPQNCSCNFTRSGILWVPKQLPLCLPLIFKSLLIHNNLISDQSPVMYSNSLRQLCFLWST